MSKLKDIEEAARQNHFDISGDGDLTAQVRVDRNVFVTGDVASLLEIENHDNLIQMSFEEFHRLEQWVQELESE